MSEDELLEAALALSLAMDQNISAEDENRNDSAPLADSATATAGGDGSGGGSDDGVGGDSVSERISKPPPPPQLTSNADAKSNTRDINFFVFFINSPEYIFGAWPRFKFWFHFVHHGIEIYQYTSNPVPNQI